VAGTAVVIALVAGALPAAAEEFGAVVDYPLVFPVDGPHGFTDGFWVARPGGRTHSSQDIFADKGVPVVAAATGTVRYVNWTDQRHLNPERCCSVVITHDDGWETAYLHLDNDSPGTDDGKAWGIADGIVPGARVEAGQLLGWVGDSQAAEDTPPHLHFQLHDPNGTRVNPYLSLVAAGGVANDAGLADPLFEGNRVLRLGDEGFDVRRLQQVLTAIEIDVRWIDGDFGPATEGAVRRFQIGRGLDPDGVVGPITKSALASDLAAAVTPPPDSPTPSVLKMGVRGPAVRDLQKALLGAGHDPGPADGIFGARTHLAVVSYQTVRGLVVDGIVGPQTRRALGLG
jgi:peptidoglycan hydrolase-like protein with peptidoglycan-binding domain